MVMCWDKYSCSEEPNNGDENCCVRPVTVVFTTINVMQKPVCLFVLDMLTVNCDNWFAKEETCTSLQQLHRSLYAATQFSCKIWPDPASYLSQFTNPGYCRTIGC